LDLNSTFGYFVALFGLGCLVLLIFGAGWFVATLLLGVVAWAILRDISQYFGVIILSCLGALIAICIVQKFIGWGKVFEGHRNTIKKKPNVSVINETVIDEIGETIQDALKVMDSTAKRYNNEEDANRELVTFLNARGIETFYQHRLPNGRTIDAKAGGTLIEGKLSPDTAEVDRLLGQLSEYAKYSDKIHVVIYGQLGEYARNRIQSEIDQRYFNKVFLNYLENPNRQRSS
jgi:hypothetical protein